MRALLSSLNKSYRLTHLTVHISTCVCVGFTEGVQVKMVIAEFKTFLKRAEQSAAGVRFESQATAFDCTVKGQIGSRVNAG